MASFLVSLYRVLTGREPRPPDTPFVDVDSASVHRGAIARLYGLGVTRGTSATTYSPGEPVTRAQMASFLVGLYQTVRPAR